MTNHPGTAVILAMAGGNAKTVTAIRGSLGKTIKTLRIDADSRDGVLIIEFTDGSHLSIYDAGLACSEHRYIRTDDDLSYYAGAKLRDVQVRNAPPVRDDENGVHEVQFLVLITDKGNITFSNHNEHNGAYGGFWIEAKAE